MASNHIALFYMVAFVSLLEGQNKLPTLYWLPKCHSDLISKINVGLKLLLQQGLSEPESYVVGRCGCITEPDYQLLDDFNMFLDGMSSIQFEVRACYDAQLLLMQNSSNFDDQLYKIIIGGWNNTKSAIRMGPSSKLIASAFHHPLDCNNLQAFWVSWDESAIHVGGGTIIDKDEFMKFNDSIILELNHIAVSYGYWIFDNYTCECCSRKLRYCQELQKWGITESGVYHVTDVITDGLFEVYCDMETDNGGWLVFQRRQDGSENFYRGWTDYENGFGDLAGEFWLGNRYLSTILSKGYYELRIDLEDWNGNKRFAKYHTFFVGTSSDNYRLTVSGYSGDAGDALASMHSSHEFTTKDRDNDIHTTENCAYHYKGGWWYTRCHNANLNGLYLGGDHSSYGDGVNWSTWKGFNYSLKRTKMMIREICLL